MIENTALQSILETATDISVVCEIYDADAVPGADGFDPVDALDCFAAVGGITFRTREYKRLVEKFGTIKRTITDEINNASVTFSNVSREISTFEFTYGFEGLILVIRLLSRSRSTALTDTQILFTGRCVKPDSGDKDSLTVNAKFVLNAPNVKIPRRKFSKDDPEGRVSSDPEFEGFLFMPQTGTVTYVRVEKRGGFLGWWNKKLVRHTMPYSSYSNLDAGKSLPEVFGRSQILGVNIGYDDVGIHIRIVAAFCEGEIEDFTNVRSTDPALPLDVTMSEHLGKVGALNGNSPGWVADAYYSRTANIRCRADNTAVDVTDAAPDVAAVVFGRLMPTADDGWVTPVWTNNGAAQVRFLLTSDDYCKLDENWIDDTSFTEVYNYNAEQIFDTSISDFVFVEPA